MNKSKINSNIQSRNWSHGDENENPLFSDASIILKGALQWKGDEINQVTFALNNIASEHSYKICGVTKCEADGEYGHPYILIHLATDGSTLRSVFVASQKHFGSLRLPIGAEAHFLFKIYDNCPKTFSCGFGSIKPLSKDGSIIICI